jgi:cellulose synthase/poly-beta-1,6-N-acetylglucosamine synthase-like glycosyltransferase
LGFLIHPFRLVLPAKGTTLLGRKQCDVYLLTIDADSVVLPDYALRLIRIMQEDPKIAVTQTPYSAFPGAPGLLERIAGATTDIQYIVHQGFTRFNGGRCG